MSCENLAGGIGILGGTFDPIHIGHVEIAKKVIEHYGLSRVYIIPAYKNPLRLHQHVVAEADDRFVMTHLATLEHPDLIVGGVEIERGREYPEPSYTFDTIERYKSRYPDLPITLIVGSDNVAFHRWFRIEEFPRLLARIAVVSRPGFEIESNAVFPGIKETFPDVANILDYLPIADIPIASTAIRESLARNIVPPDILHPLVERYIRKYGLYGLKR